jgi:hypothetical protein
LLNKISHLLIDVFVFISVFLCIALGLFSVWNANNKILFFIHLLYFFHFKQKSFLKVWFYFSPKFTPLLYRAFAIIHVKSQGFQRYWDHCLNKWEYARNHLRFSYIRTMNFYPKGLKTKEINVDMTYSTHGKDKHR